MIRTALIDASILRFAYINVAMAESQQSRKKPPLDDTGDDDHHGRRARKHSKGTISLQNRQKVPELTYSMYSGERVSSVQIGASRYSTIPSRPSSALKADHSGKVFWHSSFSKILADSVPSTMSLRHHILIGAILPVWPTSSTPRRHLLLVRAKSLE